MGFREDSLHNLYEGVNTYTRENMRFGYPGPGYRNLTKDGKFEEIRGMQRGYIRNIPTSVYDVAPPTIRCNFQFNPATLMQSVNAETAVVDMVRQSPEQYSQPKQGNTNLAFNLKFDRSYELNNFRGTITDNNVDNSDDQNFSLWSRSPREVGVYHDIDALYRVIGQGAYSDTQDYLKEIVKRRTILELNDIEGGSSGDWSGGDVGGTDIVASNEERDGTFEESLDYLVGDQGGLMNNTAFLVPQPVRLVFSSLFVVEGHVMASNVTYSRWTPSLVPIMADVSLTIDAKDIGFSRKKMFLTASLEQSASNAEKEIEEAQEAQQEAVTEALNIISSAQVGIMDITERERFGTDDSWGNTGDRSKGRSVGHVLWHLDDAYIDSDSRSLREGKGDTIFSTMLKSCYLTGDGDEPDKIEDYFANNVIKHISMGYNVELYGPYTTSGRHAVKYSTVAGGQVPQTLVDAERTAKESIPRHGNPNSNLLTSQSEKRIKVSNFDDFNTFFRYTKYCEFDPNESSSSTDALQETAKGWRAAQNALINGAAQVYRDNRVPMTAHGPHPSVGYIDLIRNRVNFSGSGEKGEMDSDLREEIYVYKWTVDGKVSFGEGEGIKADVATTRAVKWGYGTVADLFDQEHGKSREDNKSTVADRRFTMKSKIKLSWVSTSVTSSVEASSSTFPDVPAVPIRGLPAKSSSNSPGVELRGGAYARPRTSGSTPRRRDKSLAGIDPNGAAIADKRKKGTPGAPSFTDPNKDGKGPSFPI